MPLRLGVCLNAGQRKGSSQAALLIPSKSTEDVLTAAANKLRLKKKEVARARLFVWRTGFELPRHGTWPSGSLRDDDLVAISLGEPYAGPSAPVVPPADGAPPAVAPLAPLAPPLVPGLDDLGKAYGSLVELWVEQAARREAFYAANEQWWDEDGYGGSTDEEAMIGDESTSAADVEHSLKLLDAVRAAHPSLSLRSALDCGAGVGRVTKHVLLRRCERVCLLEACERWLKQGRRYLGNKRAQRCTFVHGRLEEAASLEACCAGAGGGGTSSHVSYDLIWVQWTLQYLVDADVVSTLRRLGGTLSPHGVLVLKENRPMQHTVGYTDRFQLDTPEGPNARYDCCRPDAHHRWLFRCAGLTGGLFPTHDGVFTYHEEAATPVHYRHSFGTADGEVQGDGGSQTPSQTPSPAPSPALPRATVPRPALAEYHPQELRIGGRWEWTCDRVEWSSTGSIALERGCFAGDWQLVHTNQELVTFLDEWPLVPLIVRECAYHGERLDWSPPPTLGFPRSGSSLRAAAAEATTSDPDDDEAFWALAHGDVALANSRQVSQILTAAITSDEPTTPCVTLRAITQHRYLQPPWLLRPRQWGWQVLLHSAAQASVGERVHDVCLTDELLTRHILVPVPGPHGYVSRPVRLFAWLHECERLLRDSLGFGEASFNGPPTPPPAVGTLSVHVLSEVDIA